MLKKIPSDKIMVKKCCFFLSRAPNHHNFTFNLKFLFELKQKVRLSKTVCRIFHFRFPSFLLKLYFCSTKIMNSLTLKRHNFLQNENDRKVTHSFTLRPLIFKLQQEVLNFNDICVNWSFPKTDLVTNFLNLENRSFEKVSFSQ